MQGAVIVRNNRDGLYSTGADVDLWTEARGQFGYWECVSSGVGANSWSVCYGRSQIERDAVNSRGNAKGVYLGITGLI